MLLGVVGDMSLLNASQMKQKNCCVNVLDFQRTPPSEVDRESSLRKKKLLIPGGPVSRLAQLEVPEGRVLRTNEERHLACLQS